MLYSLLLCMEFCVKLEHQYAITCYGVLIFVGQFRIVNGILLPITYMNSDILQTARK